MFLQRNVKHTSSTLFFLDLPDGFLLFDSFSQIYTDGQSLDIVSLFGLSHIHAIDVVLFALDHFAFRLWELDIEHKFAGKLFGSVDIEIL